MTLNGATVNFNNTSFNDNCQHHPLARLLGGGTANFTSASFSGNVKALVALGTSENVAEIVLNMTTVSIGAIFRFGVIAYNLNDINSGNADLSTATSNIPVYWPNLADAGNTPYTSSLNLFAYS
jgi:hypothetical protein